MISIKKILKIEKLNYIFRNIKNIKNINVLEFGVKEGYSTLMFLKVVDKNKGSLLSVDINKSLNTFNSKRWKFIQTRDDNFFIIKKYIKKSLDVIYIDSYHEPNHIKKIFYYYYKYLKPGGFIFLDDISWLPYVKTSYLKNNFSEIINRDTFDKLLEIYNENQSNLRLEFNFDSTGTAKFTKLNNKELNEPKMIYNSYFGIKNTIRKIFKIKPKK
jgi:predicted O-methyltransferase YrrM